MPRDCPRCCLFVIVSFDEHSHFGVYGELITPWKREIVLTVVSYGQLRISNVMAYGLQRFGGVFRRVAGYVDGKDKNGLAFDDSMENREKDLKVLKLKEVYFRHGSLKEFV